MNTTIFVSLEGEAKQLGSTLSRLENTLRSNSAVNSVRISSLPNIEGRPRVKDVALEILASGAAISATLVALKGLLGPYLKARALRIDNEELEALREKDGKIAQDTNGNPIYRVVKKTQIVDIPDESSASVDANLAGVLHLKVTSGSGS
jgi:hypothetical protein